MLLISSINEAATCILGHHPSVLPASLTAPKQAWSNLAVQQSSHKNMSSVKLRVRLQASDFSIPQSSGGGIRTLYILRRQNENLIADLNWNGLCWAGWTRAA